ncbi:hypothetical protein AAC387_Pa03g3944 [Persea americana]
MVSLPSPPSNSSFSFQSNNPRTNAAISTRIPSWVSLNRRCSSSKADEKDQSRGTVENIHLVSLSKQAKFKEAHEFLNAMETAGIPIAGQSFESLFEACRKMNSISYGSMFHDKLKKNGRKPSGSLGISLIRMYFDCYGDFSCAKKVFDEIPTKDLDSWSVLIAGYARNGLFYEAFSSFSNMHIEGVTPDASVYIGLIWAVSTCLHLELGKQIHSHVIRTGLVSNVSVDAALANMYERCGRLESAVLVSDRMVEKNAAMWTKLMVGYTQAGKPEEALALFHRMTWEVVELDEFVFSSVLKACSGLRCLVIGQQIHGHIVKLGMDLDNSAGTPVVDFYFKCGRLEEAWQAFKRISHPNEVSWSAVIAGFSQAGKFEESIQMLKDLRSRGMVLNSFMYTSISQACSELADLNTGSQFHADAIKRGLVSYLKGESALVTMYSRCGSLDYARRTFELIEDPDTVAWTAIIAGYAYHGHASEALGLFRRMQSCGTRPNCFTFTAIFTACSHSGKVLEARQYLDTMTMDYGVEPTINHYNCMVDIYCRSGHLEEAFELIQSMPFLPDAMTWKIILGGCKTYRNVELGKIAGENLLQMSPQDTAAYVLLFNLYASAGRWEEAANLRKGMMERGIRKEISYSWITIKGKLHRFVVGDCHHPQTDKIYSKLVELNSLAAENGCVLHTEDESADPYGRNAQLLEHSEKLAIAFGLISTANSVPILVFKNLRVCSGCHDFMKFTSKIMSRDIVVRDSIRFHHFSCGKCSCGDYW